MSDPQSELRELIVQCFDDENMKDELEGDYSFGEEDIEYFDTSAVIDRMLALTLNYGREQKMQGWHEGRLASINSITKAEYVDTTQQHSDEQESENE